MSLFTTSFIDFFLPRECISCSRKLTYEEESICEKCYSQIKYAGLSFLDSEFEKKFQKDSLIKDFLSLFIFEEESPVRSLLHGLKYQNRFRIGNFLGKILAANFEDKINNWNPDLIIPIPLHKLKKAERGYNQSYYIAKGLGKRIGIPVKTNVIIRNKFTSTQTKLNAENRKENIRNAFSVIKEKDIIGKNIILLDDVITTGATVSECSKTLKKFRTGNIYALSVGIADYVNT
ncbi:MAG: ComF family protein [Bacteroidetes bacterium]|nr:ComF family protein [Bacteroidota bacterium]